MATPIDLKGQLLGALQKRGVRPQCEVCGQNTWSVVDQPIGLPITDLTGNVVIPAPQIPVAALICNNCGNVRTFALGVLQLLPTPDAGTPK